MGSRLIDAIIARYGRIMLEHQARQVGGTPQHVSPPGRRTRSQDFNAVYVPHPIGVGLSPIWKWFKVKDNVAFGGAIFNPTIEYIPTRIFVLYNDDAAEVQAATFSLDGGVSWFAPVLSTDPAFLVNRGGAVLRGTKVDLYANRLSSVPSNFLLNIKRFTFDATPATWESVVTVLSKTTTTHFAIRRPYPFRNPADNTKRSLAWLENQRRTAAAGSGVGSATQVYTLVNRGLYGLCCPSCTSYDKWSFQRIPGDVPAGFYTKTFDISGFATSLPSFVSIRGIEIDVTRTDTGTGQHLGYLRPDLTNPGRFRLNCDSTCLNTPVGACTATHNNVTTSASVQAQLRKADGSLGSAKAIAAGAQTLGSPTDKWGFGSLSIADLATFKFFVTAIFAFTDTDGPTLEPIIELTGTPPPSVPSGVMEANITAARVFFEFYGELFVAELDASGDLVGITSLKDGLPVSDEYNGYYNPAGQEVVSWKETALDVLIHRRVKVGGVWQAETTHAYSNTDLGDQIIGGTVGAAGEFSASRKEGSEDFVALRRESGVDKFKYTYRRSVGGMASDVVFNDLRDPTVANPAPGAEAVNNDGHNLAATQPGGDIRAVVVTDDGVNFDLWFLTRAGTL